MENDTDQRHGGDGNALVDMTGFSEKLTSKKKLIYVFIYLAVLGLHCCMVFSLATLSGSYSVVAMHGFLIEVASLVAEHRL